MSALWSNVAPRLASGWTMEVRLPWSWKMLIESMPLAHDPCWNVDSVLKAPAMVRIMR